MMAVEHQRRAAARAGPGREHVRAPVLDLLPLDGEPELLALARHPGGHRLLGAGEARDRDRRERVGDEPLAVDHGFLPPAELDCDGYLEPVVGAVLLEEPFEAAANRALHLLASGERTSGLDTYAIPPRARPRGRPHSRAASVKSDGVDADVLRAQLPPGAR